MFSALQYELFVAHQESFKNYFRIFSSGVNKELCVESRGKDISMQTLQFMIN